MDPQHPQEIDYFHMKKYMMMIELDQLHHVQIQKKVEVHQKVLHQKEQKQLVKKTQKKKNKKKS